MQKIKYLNIGCGRKYHESWFNIDMVEVDQNVDVYNILKGLPYKDNSFDVVYHSQVLEHIPKEEAEQFIKECFRVLTKGGILRAVCPDLENIAREYIRQLDANLINSTEHSIANYDWIVLEMFDQTVRNETGGQMAKFLSNPNLPNEEYIVNRIGFVGGSILKSRNKNTTAIENENFYEKLRRVTVKRILFYVRRNLKHIFAGRAVQIGSFRLGGEVHMWMYDRVSLGRLLSRAGFNNINKVSPTESSIANWDTYQLDVKDGLVFDPTSLFMEATKPI
jgi:predicted SAM-dependent methyltransferase